jgi:hypothetical protein
VLDSFGGLLQPFPNLEGCAFSNRVDELIFHPVRKVVLFRYGD